MRVICAGQRDRRHNAPATIAQPACRGRSADGAGDAANASDGVLHFLQQETPSAPRQRGVGVRRGAGSAAARQAWADPAMAQAALAQRRRRSARGAHGRPMPSPPCRGRPRRGLLAGDAARPPAPPLGGAVGLIAVLAGAVRSRVLAGPMPSQVGYVARQAGRGAAHRVWAAMIMPAEDDGGMAARAHLAEPDSSTARTSRRSPRRWVSRRVRTRRALVERGDPACAQRHR